MTHSDSGPGDVMNYLVRMVVPMRREFGRQLDVGRFLHDRSYAGEVMAQALSSRDPRLLQYAKFVQQHHVGRSGSEDTVPSQPAEPPRTGETVELPMGASPSPAELREQVLRKYTSGQR